MNNCYKLCLLILGAVCLLLFSSTNISAQSLNETFTNSEVISTDLTLEDFTQKNGTSFNRQLNLGDYGTYNVVLEQTQIFHTDYQGSNTPLAFQGYVQNIPGSIVTLTANDNFLSGSIITPDSQIFFEPYHYFDIQAAQDEIIVYSKNDVISSEVSCLHNHTEQDQTYKNATQNGNLKSVVNDCTAYEAEIFLVADYSMYQEYGSEQAVIDRMTAVLNEVQTRYDDEFNAPITFTIVDTYVSDCDTCDPWLDTLNVSPLLASFRTWGNDQTTALPFDVASFWTRRDLEGTDGNSAVAGFASTGTVCGDFAYNINEDSDALANSRNVQVHELGHNFGASHDASGGNIMATNGGDGTTWSQTSQNSINTYIEGDDGACLCQSGYGCADPFAHNYDPDAQQTVDGACETCDDGIQNGPETGVDVGPTCLSDLAALACSVNPGDLCRRVLLQNYGAVVNSTNGYVGLYLSEDPDITTSDHLVGTRFFGSVNLNPNSWSIVDVCGDPGDLPDGLYYVGAIIDYQNVVPELDETNNLACTGTTYVIGGIPGCMDATACNYDPNATVDNGSCIDCNTAGETTTQSCNDGDPCTLNDQETILTCDGTVCVPCAGIFADADNDTVCDANDVCPNFDDTLIGTACDDNDACTTNDVYTSNCECKGTFQDTDNDTVCDANDVCPNFDDTLIGTACNDNDACTTNDVYTSNCECKGTFQDADNDTVCDADDVCPNVDDTLIGTACDDGNACTTNDTYDSNCECVGTFQDADNDTVCDANDVCPNFDDTLIGTACDDNSDCTTGDVYTTNCECAGTPTDTDGDGVCDADDVCPGFDDNLIGTTCDDGDDCTTGDTYNSNCECSGTYADIDNDTVCDAQDVCPNFDDTLIGTTCDDGDACTVNDVYTSNCECAGSPTDDNGEPICLPDLLFTGPCAFFGAGSLSPCISTTVINVGQDDMTTPFFMGIYLSEDETITTDDYLVGTREYDPLAVGEDVDITICGQAYLRADVPPGTYYYRAIIDYDNAQQESNENNNVTCGGFTYTIDPPGGCTDPNACNYDPDADQDNGTCIDCNTPGETTVQACDDGNPCTTNDQQTVLSCDGTVCVPCAGTFADADGDGVCDANDICPIGDDNIDTDQNGIPDACEGDACPPINFLNDAPISYGGGQDNGTVSVTATGDEIYLENNAWKAIALNYTVTPNTVVSFDFKSTRQGEIHGVGFDTNSSISSTYTFRVHGTQSWGRGNYDNYDGSGNYTTYTIPVGNFYTGQFQYFFFVTDHDASPRNGNSYFKDVRIYEDLNGDLLCDVDCNVGEPCNDGDICTINDAYNADCECVGTLQDSDGDGVCDANDVCPNFDDNLIGTACDDGDSCTENDTYAVNCECVGTLKDEDGDGTCDENDICPGFDNNLIGTTCDDGNDCTLNDVYTLDCECAGTLQDADGDDVCDDDDICPNFDDNLIGTACDDGDDCTTNDVYTSDCECAGTFADMDNDGVCDAEDVCFEFDDNLIGTPCSSGDPCTENETYNSNCECGGGTLVDSDGDGVCDAEDTCPDFDNSLIGTACNDGNDCTINDVYTFNCECAGVLADADGDGVCDEDDVCPNFDDNLIGTPCSTGDPCTENETYNSNCECGGGTLVDSDGDGVCDAEDTCPDFDNSLIGTACNDGNDCTINDVYTFNCECAGVLADADGDGVCDGDDVCPNFDDNLIGTPCSTGDPCTENETYNSNCECGGGTLVDSDGDGVCDAEDTCPDFDNSLIGTACNDGNDCTTNDVYTFNCECAGTAVNNCLPDLQLYLGDNVSCQTATDIFGVAFHFFNIVNEGAAPSTASEIGLYISADQNFDNQDILMATVAIPPLAPGEVFEVDIMGDIVAAAPGPGAYYDFTIIDHLDTINESDEDNNFACTGAGYTIAGAGCIDPNACNYDPDATEDDGSCIDCTAVSGEVILRTCDDGDPCTLNDLETVLSCNEFVCVPCAGTYSDEDGDGICDTFDNCPDFDDNLIGTACDDGNSCTTNDQYINTCECAGAPLGDTDGDGVCDGDDICEGGDDNLDNDNDGIPDYCDDSTCVTIDEIGDTCDDQNDCTENDVFVSYCVCLGTPINDADGDSVCDEDDPCPNDFSDTCDLPYCAAAGTNTNYEFIQSFSLNSNTNDSGNDGGYGDYTGTAFGSVGNWYNTFEMTPGFSGSTYAEEWAIWIDYNKDGDFDDANEEIFRGTTSGAETLSTTLYLEPGPGYYTRMRVAMRWNASPEPCGTYQYGEVEDYTVFFTNVSDKLAVESGTIQVFPNPADSYVSVDLHDIISNGNVQSVQTMIYTMDGKQVYAEELGATSILTINTQHLPEASYILRLLTDDGRTFTGKFVKL